MARTEDFDAMLFTRCPDCETTFRITAEALRKAGGQVRCGRCTCVFDAYSELREQREEEASDSEEDGRSGAQGVVFDEIGPAATGEDGDDGGDALDDEGGDALEAEWLAAADSFVEDAEPPRTPPIRPSASVKPPVVPADVDVLDDYSVAAVLEEIESSSLAAESEADDDVSAGEQRAVRSFGPAEARSTASPKLERAASPGAAGANPTDRAQTTPTDGRGAPLEWRVLAEDAPRARRAWLYASLAAFVLLGVQLANHFRSELASVGDVGPLVRDFYARIGIDLIPRWDLGQYEIVDWVATAEPNAKGRGSLRITARIQNKGPRAQPFPYVHLQLKDRWEKSVASRMFLPAEYLASNERADRLMPAGATARAELEVVDPGPDAYGFELDVCMEQPNHSVRCASDDVFR